MQKRKVILITDGDRAAQKAVKIAAEKVGGRYISASGGNPTPLIGSEIVELIKQTPYDPVLVMLDDRGKSDQGAGETALKYIARHPDVEVLGVLAVASHTENVRGVPVETSINRQGKIVHSAVDKEGLEQQGKLNLKGDTVDILNELDIPLIIGEGDIGKMDGADAAAHGAPITTKAVEEILRRSGFHGSKRRKSSHKKEIEG